jgi:hypothetical protein
VQNNCAYVQSVRKYAVNSLENSVLCDCCDLWYHWKCIGIKGSPKIKFVLLHLHHVISVVIYKSTAFIKQSAQTHASSEGLPLLIPTHFSGTTSHNSHTKNKDLCCLIIKFINTCMDDKDFCFSQSKWYSSFFLY